MENAFQIFQHEEFGQVRTILIDGEIWFVGKDVATALKYSNVSKAIIMHVDDEDKMILNQKIIEEMALESKTPILGTLEFDSPRGLTFINESGLYSLILSSKLPDAKKFKRWVTSEVLPSIRKTGSYSLPKNETQIAVQNTVQNQPPVLHKMLEDIKTSYKLMGEIFKVQDGIAIAKVISIVERFNGVVLPELKELIPPAEHEIGRYTPTQLAKKFGLKSAQAVNQILLEAGLQEKDGNGGYILTEKGAEYAEAMPYERNGHTGYQIKWTPEVVEFFK